jgi:hypothetical protein
MKTRTHFAHRIEMLDAAGEVQEHLAGVEDYILAEAVWQGHHSRIAVRWRGLPTRTSTACLSERDARVEPGLAFIRSSHRHAVKRLWDREPECFRGLEIQDEHILVRTLNR